MFRWISQTMFVFDSTSMYGSGKPQLNCSNQYLASKVNTLQKVSPSVRSQKKALAKLVASSNAHERMSRSEIQSWVHAAKKLGDDFDNDDDDASHSTGTATPLDPAQQWQDFILMARRSVTQARTVKRVNFLREKLLAVAERGGKSTRS